ncbi:MAG: hypothetical protein UY92_C0001G0029 [Candidatus Magasanikbacteria bacterium GW2011_GWA2_56_11]|uniref:Methyltransferase type 11 domain-containing protein n=1 Tax=Candidatus Magasanikbacteria bacterium GW2011_GWA2_56_11 TaxID=1619044 RepID=A0A0G1YIH5_9BACT|nr:MAG: hypothetical protein UY92_C0001G0029 [Candidatus Magasanikbacteria bacterium GW2011_GWA2_56_11]
MPAKETFATPWKDLANRWEAYYTPPGRPSPEDCQLYAKYVRRALGKKKSGRALVLGATPEIRNLLHKLPVEVTSLDINLEMILAMNRFVPQCEKDILVRGSWVDNPLKSGYFDAVIGDYSWSNVPRRQWTQFNETVARLLTPAGLYVHRVHLVPDGWQRESALPIVQDYASRPYSRQLAFELFFKLLTNTYNKRDRSVSMRRIWDDLASFWRAGKFVRGASIPGAGRLLADLHKFWGTTDKTWQIGYKSDLLADIGPYFQLGESVKANDYDDAGCVEMWICRKRP